MKYMVMECHFSYAVVLDEAGRFLKVANRHYEVGQTVTDIIEMQVPQPPAQEKSNHRWIYSLTAMAACLILVVSMMFFQAPYASVYLTINPEVRIDVSRNDTVVGVEGINADGMELLSGYDHRKKDLDTVMDELVDLAIEMGYLHEGGRITLSLDADEAWVVSHGEHLNQHLNEHLTDRITVTIDVEQKQSAPAPETAPGETFVIPVNPGNYGESDYGDDVSGNGDSGYSSDEGDSGYDIPGDGQTDYDDSLDEEDSNYDSSSSDDAQSSYGNDSEDDGESNFGSDSDDDVQSDYDDADSSQSGYAAAPEDEAASDYDIPDSDDSQSDYESSDDDGQSGYESDDSEEASDYEENDD